MLIISPFSNQELRLIRDSLKCQMGLLQEKIDNYDGPEFIKAYDTNILKQIEKLLEKFETEDTWT